jgi:hypothetical protein
LTRRSESDGGYPSGAGEKSEENTQHKNTVDKIEQGEAWEVPDEVVKVEVKRPLDKVIPIRLSSDKWEQIRAQARLYPVP